jgi:hypothetical protein
VKPREHCAVRSFSIRAPIRPRGERKKLPKATPEREIKVAALRLEDCINETCPWSGKPVQADSLMRYQGQVVGFCNPGCRDKFEQAVTHFELARKRADGAPGANGLIGSGR